MNEHTRRSRDCKLGIKAYQNILGSLQAFERLHKLMNSKDHLAVSSIFHMAVIRYAKPFVVTGTNSGLIKYPVRHIKKVGEFSTCIHNHLIEIRNTLIAHDDFEQIEPRILNFGFTLNGLENLIPTSVVIANKCISYPADLAGVEKMKCHVAAALSGIAQKLCDDIARLRALVIENPKLALGEARYSKRYGNLKVPKGGAQLIPPDFMGDEWLNTVEPDFSKIHNGFHYEEIKVKLDFRGPEKIKLSNGSEIEIKPRPY